MHVATVTQSRRTTCSSLSINLDDEVDALIPLALELQSDVGLIGTSVEDGNVGACAVVGLIQGLDLGDLGNTVAREGSLLLDDSQPGVALGHVNALQEPVSPDAAADRQVMRLVCRRGIVRVENGSAAGGHQSL